MSTEHYTTMLVIRDGTLYTESTALLKALQHLGFPFNLMSAGYLVPRFIRDFLYRVIALNRYTLFGKTEYCLIPSGENKRHFLENALRESKPVFNQVLCSIGLSLAMLWFYQGLIQKFCSSPLLKSQSGKIWVLSWHLPRPWWAFLGDVKCCGVYAF